MKMSEIERQQAIQRAFDKAMARYAPTLTAHGGGAELVSIDNAGVTLRVLGACNGCAMSAFTFQLGIEKMLRDAEPELIKEVRYVH